VTESIASSPNNTNMVIDTDSPTEAGHSGDISGAPATSLDQCKAPKGPSADFGPEQAEASAAKLPFPPPCDVHDKKDISSDNPAVGPSGIVSHDQAPLDGDVPMQISDAEDDDNYEPVPSHISETAGAYGTHRDEVEVMQIPH
jgi:hypothetical protein